MVSLRNHRIRMTVSPLSGFIVSFQLSAEFLDERVIAGR
jgi:hypothetical protein